MAWLFMGLVAVGAFGQSRAGAAGAQPRGAYGYFARAGVAFGGGGDGNLRYVGPTVQVGGLVSMPFFDVEGGVLGPQAGHSKAGYVTTNLWMPLGPLRRVNTARTSALITGGYTREFDAGNALDYGLGLAHTVREGRSIEFDVRDYWMPSNSSHTLMFRIVLLVGLAD